MKTMKGETKTTVKKADGTEEKIVVARWEYEAPESAAEFKTWAAANETCKVSAVAVGVNGSADKAVTPEDVSNFDAWQYGMSLKANTIGRDNSQLATTVKDHKLSIGGKTTDLDTLDAAALAKSLNTLAGAMGAGISFGPTNTAKIESKTAQAIEAGLIHKGADGQYAVGKAGNGKPPTKK